MVCDEAQKIQNEELDHKTKYKPGYDDLSEEELYNMSYAEEQEWIADHDAEDRFHDEHRTKHGNHLSTCSDPGCQTIKNNWKGHAELSKYIH